MLSFKFCPMCAAPLVPNAEGVLACPRGEWAAWPDVVVTASALPIRDDRVLLGRRGVEPHKGSLCVIGGFVAPGETLEAAAVRELLEEAGLQGRITGLMGSYPDEYRGKPTLNVHFRFEIIDGAPRAQDDVSELIWYPILELSKAAQDTSFANDRDGLLDLERWYRREQAEGRA